MHDDKLWFLAAGIVGVIFAIIAVGVPVSKKIVEFYNHENKTVAGLRQSHLLIASGVLLIVPSAVFLGSSHDLLAIQSAGVSTLIALGSGLIVAGLGKFFYHCPG